MLYAVLGSCGALLWTQHDELANLVLVIAVVLALGSAYLGGGKLDDLLDTLINRMRAAGNRIVVDAEIALADGSLKLFRTAGDEASGFLAIGQMTSWVVFTLFRVFGSAINVIATMEVRFGEFVTKHTGWGVMSMLGSFGLVGVLSAVIRVVFDWNPPIESVILAGLVPLLLFLRVTSLLIEPVLSVAAACVAFICYLPFGFDLAVASPVVSVTVESAPEGRWELITVGSGDAFLAHSLLYDTTEVAKAVAMERFD
jgi:hypothetical protein